MLYKQIADLIVYIDQNYGDKLTYTETVTNGTVIPQMRSVKKIK